MYIPIIALKIVFVIIVFLAGIIIGYYIANKAQKYHDSDR